MLTNINSRGLSKFKKVTVIKNPGRKSNVMEKEIEAIAKENNNIYTFIVYTGTNDLTKNISTLRSVKEICEKTKKLSLYEDCFFERYFSKG